MNFSSTGAVYSAKFKSRVLASQIADADRHRFFIGSSCLREGNEIQLVEFNGDMMVVEAAKSYFHAKEITALAPSPVDSDLLLTLANDGESGLWRCPGASDSLELDDIDPRPVPMERVATLTPRGCIKNFSWQSQGSQKVASFGSHLSVFDLTSDAARVSFEVKVGEHGPKCVSKGGCWDPHSAYVVAAVHGCGAVGWDTRVSKQAFSIIDAHQNATRDVDYNPNKPLFLASCGDDRLIKFWDLRKKSQPVKVFAGHSHWCWTVRYNRFHDQLVLSGGTDSLVNLWRCSSISSAPLLELDTTRVDSGDGIIRSYTEHEESIYSVAWSACDAWVFASLDCSGRLAINHVPSTEKYKILL